MTAAGAMSYADLKKTVLQLAHMTDLGLAEIFIGDAYEIIWSADEWTFRREIVNVNVVANTQAVSGLPSDLGLVNGVWRGHVGDGQRLIYQPPDVFVNRWSNNNVAIVQPGPPFEYTVIDDDVLVGPAANETASDYSLMHFKRFTPLVEDVDVPALPLGTHMAIAYAAAATGLVSENDFFFQFCDGRYQARLEAMRREYTVTTREEPGHWPSAAESWPTYD